MATPNYDINYNDKRFTEVEADKKAALNEVDVTYGNMISQSDKYYQKQMDAAQNWADKQSQLQQEQTDFTIEKIEQQKAQAQKDYTKEQSGAYVDWQKQSNQYGANAEQMAAQGLTNTGFSESSQVSMYNTYQNRVATARESYMRAVLNYDNAIKDARLQNNSALAEIAYQALQTQLELSLQGFQYKNQLLIEQSNKKMEVDNNYYNRYQDVLNQINHENALAEEVRQYNQDYALKEKEYEEGIRQFNEEIARLKAKDAQENKLEIQKLELQKAQLAEEKRQFNIQNAQNQAKIAKSGGSGGSSKKSSGKAAVTKKNTNTGTSGLVKSGQATNVSVYEGSGKSSSNTIDMGSVLALGYGPISASKLNSLVKQGLVEEYQSGGKTKFRKSSYTNKQASLFKSLK